MFSDYLNKSFDLTIFNKTGNSLENVKVQTSKEWDPNDTNKNYKIYDNLLSKNQIQNINKFSKTYNWKYNQVSIYQSSKNKIHKSEYAPDYKNHWSNHFSYLFFKIECINNLYFYNLFYDTILPKLDIIEDKKNIIISRMYLNSHTLGCAGSFHKDGKPLCNNNFYKNYTVLLFINNDWNINFNGETSFLLNDKIFDSIVHIHSKPGRIVVFSSHITHKACDVSPYSLLTNKLRRVIAYHLYYPNYNTYTLT